MKRLVVFTIISSLAISLAAGGAYAGSNKTWANIGKGLAIYEGVKVLTGREGNIVDDVTGGMQPRRSSTTTGSSSQDDAYNAGYTQGYKDGYNAGFRHGVDQSR